MVFWLSSQTGIPLRCPVFVCGIFGKLWGRGQYHLLQAVVSALPSLPSPHPPLFGACNGVRLPLSHFIDYREKKIRLNRDANRGRGYGNYAEYAN